MAAGSVIFVLHKNRILGMATPKDSTAKQTTTKATTAKAGTSKTTAKKAAPKKTTAKKSTAKKTTTGKSTAKSTTSKKATTTSQAKTSTSSAAKTTAPAATASKTTSKPKAPKLSQTMLKEKYLQHIKDNKKRPSSVYNFAKYLGVKSKEFYNYYQSLGKLEKDIWKDFLDDTLTRLSKEPAYQDYVAQEKLLAFYFTFIEVLKPYRDYIVFASGSFGTYTIASSHLDELRDGFLQYANSIIQEGIQTEEVVERPYITGKYNLGLWTQLLFVLNFWVGDETKDFAKTDEAVEKAVNLSFDLMGRTPLDTLVDFGQFVIKNKFL